MFLYQNKIHGWDMRQNKFGPFTLDNVKLKKKQLEILTLKYIWATNVRDTNERQTNKQSIIIFFLELESTKTW